MKGLTKQQKRQEAINLIICNLKEEQAAEVIFNNGYAKSIKEAEKIVTEVNGKLKPNWQSVSVEILSKCHTIIMETFI